MKKGIDVSSYQGTIDWEKVKQNIEFAIIRCGYGGNKTSQDDNRYLENAKECERLEIPYGVYLYSYATNLEEAQSEVDHTLRLIQNRKLEYPVYLDIESEEQKALDKDSLVNIVEYYCQKMEEAGYYVGIYSNLDWFINRLDSPKLDPYDHWLAQWNEKPTYTKPFGMWQYTSKLTLNGIEGFVDGDIAYKDYPTIIKENHLNHLQETISVRKFKVGDQVTFTGTLYQDSYGNGKGQSRKNLSATITRVNDKQNSTKPYNINNGLGWVSENDLTIANNNNEIKVGSSVQILSPGRSSKDGNTPVALGIGWNREVLEYDPNALYPYRIGNKTGTTGYYKRDALKKL